MIGRTVTHYRIVEKLGEGGMGVVYKAEDTRLKRNVALKFFPPDLPAGEEARSRFVQEAQAAAAIDHPNICPVYEIHDADDAVFIAMGYVDGPSLQELIARAPLPVAQALDLIIQVATGLEAAHESGIVHRDIKPANIMVSSRGQARITDFGLARWAGSSRLTRTGSVMGTTAYMSPEQTRGEAVDARSDIWSLGVVLYEALTGRRPFQGDVDAAVVYAVLMDEPVPVSSLRNDLPEGLDRIVDRALAKDPDARYRHISEMRQDLIALTRSTLTAPVSLHADHRPLTRPAPSNRRLRVGAGVLLLAVSVAGLYLWSSAPSRPDPVLSVVPRRTVAVLDFENRSPQQEAPWLSTALSEMLSTTLSGAGELRTLPGEVVSRMETELALPEAGPLDEAALSQIRLNVGADLVVKGSYATGSGAGDSLQVAVQVHDARTGETLTTISQAGMQGQLFDLVARAGQAILAHLGAEAPSSEVGYAAEASLPRNLETARLYAEGLEKLRRYDLTGAVDALERLIARAPDYPMAYSALGRAWTLAGNATGARAASEQALAHAAGLSREQRLLLEGTRHEALGNWDEAVETYKILYGFFPDNLEYGLLLARAQTAADRAGDALDVVAQLRQLPPPAGQDARIDLAECAAADGRSDFERLRIAAARARMKAGTQGASLLMAEAWYNEGWALWNLGEPAKAVAAYQEARTHFKAAGLQGREADMLNAIAVVAWDEGRLDEALAGLNDALAIKRETGEQGSQASILNNISNIYKSKGELERARTILDEAVALRRTLGQEGALATNLSNLANLLRDQGDLAGAERHYREAVEIARRISRKHTEASTLMNLAELQHTTGDLAGAQASHEAALELSRETNRGRDIGFSLWGLGRLALTEDDLPRAVALYDSSVAVYRSIEFDYEAEATRLWLAEAFLEQGRYDEAEAILGPALAYLQEQGASYEALFAATLLVRLYIEQKRFDAARQAAGRIDSLAEGNQNFEVDALITISTARLLADDGRVEEALRRLQDVVAESERRHFTGTAFDARLATGEVETWYGDAARGNRLLQALETDASARGFALIARKAARAR